MKKFASLLVALVLCIGMTVTAFASEYGTVTIGGSQESVTFDAAVIEEPITLNFQDPDTGTCVPEQVIPVAVKPGSNVTSNNGSYAVYGRLEEDKSVLYVTGEWPYIPTGSVDDMDSHLGGIDSDKCAFIFYAFNGDEKTLYWLRSGSAAPAAAADIKCGKFTYHLSNEPVGTMEHRFTDPELDEIRGAPGTGTSYTIYLVPKGTVVTTTDSNYAIKGNVFSRYGEDEANFSMLTTVKPFEVSNEGEIYYLEQAFGEIGEFEETLVDENGIWLAVALDDPSAKPQTPAEPTTPTQPTAPAAPGSYTVKKGDTWSSICTNFYGTNAQRYALMNANKGVKLVPGTVITLPEKLGGDMRIPTPVVGEGEKLYTVKLGDTLGKIALAEYGKMSAYKAIFERNADRLANANTIYEGQVIVLPAK